jgi:hypothetical protein
MPMTRDEQVQFLRQHGYGKEAGMLERGELPDPPPDAFDRAQSFFNLGGVLRALVGELKAARWSVTIRSKYGDTDTVRVQSATELEAAFIAGQRTKIPGAELVSVEAAQGTEGSGRVRQG